MIYKNAHQTAENLTEFLRKEFPATTFAVNAEENPLLSSVTIMWKDGPLLADVRRTVNWMKGSYILEGVHYSSVENISYNRKQSTSTKENTEFQFFDLIDLVGEAIKAIWKFIF